MILFNELRITPDLKHLLIDVQIPDLSYYSNMQINSIYIDTLDNFSSLGVSAKAILISVPEGSKHYRTFYDLEGLGANNMFFVYVLTSGDVEEGAPCDVKANLTLSVIYNKLPLYQEGMKLLNSMQGCNPDDDLKDFILRKDALDISLDAGDYTKAIEYWNMFFGDKTIESKGNCGCHGVLG